MGPSDSKDNGSQDDGDTGSERSTVSVARTDSPPAPKSLSEKDFAKVDYSLPDFSSLDYKKGPKGEKLETKDGGEKKLDWSDKNELIETPKGRKYTEEGYFDSSGVFVRHGLMTLWHDQAKVVKAAELQWFNNIHHGPTTVWDDKGHKLVSLSKVNGQGHGKRMVWDADGNKECEDYLFQGAFHGPRTVWHPNGTIKQKAFIWHGAFHGDVTEWHPNGEVAFKSTFKNGMYDGTFTRWHDNKQKAAKFTYSNTGRVGEGTIWYKSGTLRYTLHYSPTSKHDGKWTDWYDDGTKEAERHFENGRYVGVHTRWNKKGRIIWRYAFDANNTPLVHETTCHGFIAQVASLYGTEAGWNWQHIDTRRVQRFGQLGPGETYTDYTFTNTTHRPSEADFLQVCGKPDSILNADDSGFNQEWIYRCHDGTITICVTTYGRLPNPNVKTALKIYDTRADGLRSF